MTDDVSATLHATCVAVEGNGILITGASGTGKSALALHLIALGADLVADDQTILTHVNDTIVATCPPPLIGMIEARGLGLLAARSIANTEIRLIVDLDRVETERLPERRHRIVLGVAIDLVFHGTSRHFPYGLIQYARHGRVE